MKKYLLALVLICFLSTNLYAQPPVTKSEGVVLMDAKTGQVLYSQNMNKKLYPASITKIMTALIAAENGNMSDVLEVSQTAVDSVPRDTTHIALNPGEKLSLDDAMYALMMESANDAAAVIAEYIGTTQYDFVKLMNERALSLGAKNTHFTNVHGLFDPNHVTTAYDMALITKEAINNTTFMDHFGKYQYKMPATNKQPARLFNNQQKMIPPGKYGYDGVIGGKLGWTTESTNTMVTVAKKDNRTLICVVMKTKSGTAKYDDTKALFNYGFSEFTKYYIPAKKLPSSTEPFYDKNGKQIGKVKIYAENGLSYLLHNSIDNNTVEMNYKVPDKITMSTPIKVSFTVEDNIATTNPELARSNLEKEPKIEMGVGSKAKSFLLIAGKISAVILGIILTLYLILLIGNLIRKMKSTRRKVRIANKKTVRKQNSNRKPRRK